MNQDFNAQDQGPDFEGHGAGQPDDHSHDLHGSDAGPLPGELPAEPLVDEQATLGKALAEGEAETFDLAKFLPQGQSLLVLPTVKSNSSDNVYTCVASKGESKVGVSVTLNVVPDKAKSAPMLVLLTRYLEVPNHTGHSAFENPGEERQYLMDDLPCKVYMLRKDTMPLCDARVSPWEVRYHLDAGVREQLNAWVWETLINSGCAINCKDETELSDILFSRLNQLADTPSIVWKSLEGLTPKAL